MSNCDCDYQFCHSNPVTLLHYIKSTLVTVVDDWVTDHWPPLTADTPRWVGRRTLCRLVSCPCCSLRATLDFFIFGTFNSMHLNRGGSGLNSCYPAWWAVLDYLSKSRRVQESRSCCRGRSEGDALIPSKSTLSAVKVISDSAASGNYWKLLELQSGNAHWNTLYVVQNWMYGHVNPIISLVLACFGGFEWKELQCRRT